MRPLNEWPAIAEPMAHLEKRMGQYLAMYEGAMDAAFAAGQFSDGVRILHELLKYTPVGRPKADITIAPGANLDLSHLKDEDLLKLVGEGAGEGLGVNDDKVIEVEDQVEDEN